MIYNLYNADFAATKQIAAVDLVSARDLVAEWAVGFDHDLRHGTVWTDVVISDVRGNYVETVTVQVDPPIPACPRYAEHDWQRPYEIVWKDLDFPGVIGHGGGFLVYECCTHCGARRVTDTWAQRPDTGEHGFMSVWYDGPGYYEVAQAA